MRLQTHPLAPRSGRPDRRRIVVVKTYGTDARYRGTINTFTMTAAVAVCLDDQTDVQFFERPEEFWPWLQSRGRSILLVVAHADRDLATLGDRPAGDGWKLKHEPIHADQNRPKLYWAAWRREAGACRHVDIMQMGNLHPEGVYCDELSLKEAVDWLTDWCGMIREHDLGPKIEWTLARQSLLSYRREADQHDRRLRWHDNEELHRFEREVLSTCGPVRLNPEDAFYPKLHVLDFTAFYVWILATRLMPQEPLVWLPEGCDPEELRRPYRLVLADITDTSGVRRLVTTPQLGGVEVAEVHRLARYRPGRMMQPWAEKMYRLRESVPPEIRPAVKGLAVSLWGRLSQRNHGFRHDPDHEYVPGEEAWYGAGNVVDHATGGMERFTEDGERWASDPDAWRRERFPALGAHVLAHGRAEMERWMRLVHPVYCHTDSIWSIDPVPETNALPRGLGGVTQKIRRNVEFRNGVRYVDGEIDAAPGVQRAGLRRWQPYDDPELAAMPGVAAWETRQ